VISSKSISAVVGFVALALAAVPLANGVAAKDGAESAGAQSDYRLGAQDKVRIKVYEWRPARDEIYEWTAFKAEYTVNPSGFLSLPLLGDVAADGLSTKQLAQDLGARLKDRMGFLEPPDVTVEVVEFRPFYVVGAVEKPGEYPYRPGLTVLGAYAIAGGKQRNGLGTLRLERESISTRGDLHSFDLESQALQARMARLKAELDDAAEINWPQQIKRRMEDPALTETFKQEQLVFDTRREAHQTQVDALKQLQSYLDKEVLSLDKQLQVHETATNSVRAELDMVMKLYKKGLTAAPRKLALERNMAQVDGERLRLEASLMRARQEISKTKIAIVDLQAKRSSDISTEMQKTQARIDEIKARAETSKNLLYETEVLAPQLMASEENAKLQQPVFKILRKGQVASSEQVVSQDAIVNPGDTIMVEQPARESQLGQPFTKALPPVASQASRPTPTASVEISTERLR
jgi:protein involved in polysaccharide export with SLBB domain